MADFREQLVLTHSPCDVDMVYDSHYASFRCPKCEMFTFARLKRTEQ